MALPAQTTVQWSDSTVVTSTPNPITAPRVALLPDGTPLVTWGVSGNNIPSQIWCSRFENGAFSTPVGVVQSPAEPDLFGFGGYEVAVSDSQVFVVFEQIQQGILLARSDDGGLTFDPPTTVQSPISGGYVTISSVTVDGTGNPVVSYIREKNGATYQVRRSTDGGFNFDDPVTANTPAPGGAVCECCASDLLASGDSVWMVFRNNNQNLRDIWVSRSTDLAATFDTATDVDDTDWHLNTCPVAGPRMARSGDSLLTVWMSAASGTSRVYLSTLHAGTMQAGQQLAFPTSTAQTAQSVADVTALGDTVGVVFLEKSKEIVFCFSTNGTVNLTNQSTRFALPNHTLQYPSLAFRDGVFHLVYADATADKVLYRQGRLAESSPTSEPTEAYWGVSVFPNPVTAGGFWVKSEADELQEVSLFDVFGKKIFGQKPAGRDALVPTGNLPKGIYFLKIKTPQGEMLREIVLR
ncbi:MAG: T9SS type A sorting domain-containing protein [Saprospiraceae bacterium]